MTNAMARPATATGGRAGQSFEDRMQAIPVEEALRHDLLRRRQERPLVLAEEPVGDEQPDADDTCRHRQRRHYEADEARDESSRRRRLLAHRRRRGVRRGRQLGHRVATSSVSGCWSPTDSSAGTSAPSCRRPRMSCRAASSSGTSPTDPRGPGPHEAVAVTGLVIVFVIGTLVAIVMSQARGSSARVLPVRRDLQTIPLVAFAADHRSQDGLPTNSRIVICVMISMFPIIANTLFGLKSATGPQHDLFTLHRASRWARLASSVPRRVAGDLLRPADLRRSVGVRCHRRQVLLRAGDPATAGLGRQLSVYQSLQRTHRVITALPSRACSASRCSRS